MGPLVALGAAAVVSALSGCGSGHWVSSANDSGAKWVSDGCQATRTAQLPTVDFGWFGRKLTQVAARFSGIPPIFVR